MSVQPALGKTPSKVSRLISCQPLEDRGITSPSQVSSGHGPAFGMGPHPSASGVKSADLVFQKAMWAMGPAERIPLPDWLLLANRSDQGPHRESRGASSPQKGLRERLSDRPSSQTHWPLQPFLAPTRPALCSHLRGAGALPVGSDQDAQSGI